MGSIEWTLWTNITFWINFIFGYWNYAILLGTLNFIIACTTVLWYFSDFRDDSGFTTFKAFNWCFGYHIGTVMFGSLLIALCWVVQTILTMVVVSLFFVLK